jgi:hypothetical protein
LRFGVAGDWLSIVRAVYGATDAWDFTTNQYLRAGVIGPAGLTVTRASSGYAETVAGALVSFASGVARRTDRGLLVEGAATNLFRGSQQFDGANWNPDRVTVATDNVIAPDGTLSADTLTVTSTSGSETGLRQTNTAQANATQYTASVFAKYGSVRYLVLRNLASGVGGLFDQCAFFDLQNGTLGTRGSDYTASSIQSVGNGWYRCTATSTTVASIVASLFDIRVSDADATFANTTGRTVAIWGAQLETGPFATSQITTTAASVTRQADQITAVLSGVAYPLSLYAEFVRNGDTGGDEGVFQVDASSRAQRSSVYISSSDTLSVSARGGADAGDAAVAGAVAVGAITKSAGRIESNNVQAARAGTLATADTTASVPTSSPGTVRFGDFGSAATYGFIYLRRAAIIPAALTDAQLQGITT